MAGFLVPVAWDVLIVVAYRFDALPPGWRGGEFVEAFLWSVFVTLLLGVVLTSAARTIWRALGRGLVFGGVFGLLLAGAAFALFMYAFAHSNIPW